MAVRKRIALLIGQSDEFYQRRFIDGFLTQAFSDDFDVCIFSMYLKYQNTEARERGDKRIYSLVNFELFDAVVVLPDTLQTPGLAEEIEERIHKEFQGPVLYVDLVSRFYPSILTDSYTPVKRLIEHLIKVHGYTDIAYLTGKKWHAHSKARLQAFRDAMAEAGLKVREDRVFFGDFWYTSGNSCAEELLKNRDDLPEAVACANDCMAIGLAEELSHAGLQIPEDIAVIGFDTSDEGQNSPKPLTSAYIPAKQTGARAARSIANLMKGGDVDESSDESEMYIGMSCGCTDESCAFHDLRRESWTTVLSEESFFSLHNHFIESMLAQTDLGGFWDIVYSHIYQIKGYESLHICLPKDWAEPDFKNDGTEEGPGYPEKMVRTIASYGGGGGSDRIGKKEIFATKQLLPELHEMYEKPKAYIFTPLYYEARRYGYAVISYGEQTRSYDEVYRLWMRSLGCGLESMRRTLMMQVMREKGAAVGLGAKFPSGIAGAALARAEMTQEDKEGLADVQKILDENLFTYHFQPIVSAADGSIYAFEALMRSRTEKRISPLDILKYADMLQRLPDVERATFINVLARLADEEDAFNGRHIFINSIPGTKLSEEDEKQIEELLTKRGRQAVVELTEQAELDDASLEEVKQRYARLGIGTAVDDYGTGYSNIANLLRYMPNYVKVDRSLLSGIQDSPQKQHFVREIVSFSRDNDILVLAEGVETQDELRTVIYLGCDLIQGYYTGRPAPEIITQIDQEIIDEICKYQKERQEGTYRRSYKTGRSGRISTGTLVREGYQYIVTTGEAATYRDYVLSGTPGQDTELVIEVQEGYEGEITLENVSLVSAKHRPCIDIAPGARVALVLRGENHLTGGGVNVPEGAQLTVYGDGDLKIRTNQKQYAAVGAAEGKAGKLEFYQDGTIEAECGGTQGVGIGGADGADIKIHRGRYVIRQNGNFAVGIGSGTGELKTVIHDCELDLSFSGTAGAGIGVLNGSAEVGISKVYLHCNANGEEYVALGSCRGAYAKVEMKSLGTDIDVRAAKGSGIGAIIGNSELLLDSVGYRYTGSGDQNYAFAGINRQGHIRIDESNINIRIRNEAGQITTLDEEAIEIGVCRMDQTVNGVPSGQRNLF